MRCVSDFRVYLKLTGLASKSCRRSLTFSDPLSIISLVLTLRHTTITFMEDSQVLNRIKTN
jgi:hypothetical protein